MKDFSSLKIKSPYNIKYIEDVKFDWKPNEHASFYLKGIVEDSAQFNAVNSAGDGDEFTLYEGEEGKTIFKGQTSSVKVTNVNGIYYIELKGISGSFNLDQSKKSRSFQDENMEYGSLISQTIKDYSGSNFMQYVGEGEKIGNPIIQYKETAWEFLKRMASKFNSVIVCDIMENKPRFYFGLPERRGYTIDDDIPYIASKDIKAFEETGAAEAGLSDIDFFYYEIENGEQYSIGNEINFRNKNLVVTEVHVYMDRGLFKYKYKLSRKEGLYCQEIKNRALSGAAFDGKILAVQGQTVRMHLNIDSEQVTTKAHWFPFAPPTGNMMYCMPKVGTSARLYFPNSDPENAEVTGSVRDNGGSCAKTGNPNNRYFGTEHGSELAMLPDSMSIKGGSKSPLSIKFDGSGVILTSPKKLTLSATEDVFLKTPKKIIINATNKFLATKGKEVKGISVEGDVNCLGGAAKIEAKDRTTYPNFNDEPKEDKAAKKKAEEAKKAADKKSWLTIGLCALAAVAVVAVAVVATVATGGAAMAIIGPALIGAAIGGVSAFATTKGSLEDKLKAAAIGAIVGLVCGAVFGPASGFVTDALTGGISSVLTDVIDKLSKGESINPLAELKNFAEGALIGAAFGGLLRGAGKLGGKALEGLSPWIKNSAKDINKEIPKSNLYEEFNKITDPQMRYEYLLNKAKTMDVSTEKNKAIFYAGRIQTKSGIITARQMAEKYADQLYKEKGIVKLTLERTPGGKWMDDLKLYEKLLSGEYKYEKLGLTVEQTNEIWHTLSSRYADGASGAVTAFAKNVPDEWKPKTIFWTTELPQLRKNINVTHVNIR